MTLKSTKFSIGFNPVVNDTSHWISTDGVSIAPATYSPLLVKPDASLVGEEGDMRTVVIRFIGNTEDQLIDYRIYSLADGVDGEQTINLIISGQATVGTSEVGGDAVYKNAITGNAIDVTYCDTLTGTASSYATTALAALDNINGIQMYSPGSNGICELWLPDCLGTRLLIALKPNSATGTFVGYRARAFR